MLAYASRRPNAVPRQPAPHAMLAIIAAHVALLAAVMSARIDLPERIRNSPLVIDFIHEDDPPPANPQVTPQLPQQPRPSVLDQPEPIVPAPAPSLDAVDSTPVPLPDPGPSIGPRLDPDPRPTVTPAPVRSAAQLLTSPAELKPAYPASKLASGEEAVLRLRLAIDERGRVVGVEPLGRADRAFFDAARRHLIAHWRYRPASEDGRAVASSLVVTLRFELEG